MNNELVSIVIPVYNVPDVTGAVDSCLRQTYENIEVIVVDDGSDKMIGELIAEIKDSRLRYIRREVNTNADVCRNIGIDAGRGKYIAFLDSDDLYMRRHIESCVVCLELTDADGMYGSVILDNGKTPRVVMADQPWRNENIINYLLRNGYGACTSTLFMTRESAVAVRWDETLNRHQDYDFVVRFADKFSWTAKEEATVVYNSGPRPRPKGIDFASCIRFSEANKQNIIPSLYRCYITNMLKLAKSYKSGGEIITYYENELK